MTAKLQIRVVGHGNCGDISGWKVRFKVDGRYVGTFGPYRTARKSDAVAAAKIAAQSRIRLVESKLRCARSSGRSGARRSCCRKG